MKIQARAKKKFIIKPQSRTHERRGPRAAQRAVPEALPDEDLRVPLLLEHVVVLDVEVVCITEEAVVHRKLYHQHVDLKT